MKTTLFLLPLVAALATPVFAAEPTPVSIMTVTYRDQDDVGPGAMYLAGLHRTELNHTALKNGVTIAAAFPRGGHTYSFTLGRKLSVMNALALADEFKRDYYGVESVSVQQK